MGTGRERDGGVGGRRGKGRGRAQTLAGACEFVTGRIGEVTGSIRVCARNDFLARLAGDHGECTLAFLRELLHAVTADEVDVTVGIPSRTKEGAAGTTGGEGAVGGT